MVLGQEDDLDVNRHPYWYARVIKIFSVTFRHMPPEFINRPSDPHHDRKTMHVLWVRWLGRDIAAAAGWGKRRLHTVGFVPGDDYAAFGFLDPQHIVRGVHLIPAFAFGQTNMYMGPGRSIARRSDEGNKDYKFFYVGW